MDSPSRTWAYLARRFLLWLLAACPLMASGAPRLPSQELLSFSMAQATPPLVLEPGQVVITFTFADTFGSQRVLRPMLARHGMHATFYVNSGRIGRGDYLTLEELRAFAAEGHEIASHTVDHVNPAPLPLPEARHQICDDRAQLMALGFPITSFAYPFSGDAPLVRQIVVDCGFNNARATGGIRSPDGCASCPPSETVPPRDTFIIRTPPSIKSSYTLADLQSLVLQAEAAGGGWVMISFHGICADCGTYGVTAELLESFLVRRAGRVRRRLPYALWLGALGVRAGPAHERHLYTRRVDDASRARRSARPQRGDGAARGGLGHDG